MGSKRFNLGQLLSLKSDKNTAESYGAEYVRGISTDKKFIPTKADLSQVNLKSYKIVEFGDFAYVPDTSRRGDKISLGYQQDTSPILVSSISVVFYVKRPEILLPGFLFLYFNRPEFDRYARYNSWGSARESFSWREMCDIELDLPPIDIQQKYVDLYHGMHSNQQNYLSSIEELRRLREILLEKYKVGVAKHPLGELVSEVDQRNADKALDTVYGVKKEKSFMLSTVAGSDLRKYKRVQPGQFACNLMHVGRDKAVPIALNDGEEPILVSPAYVVFEAREDRVTSDYLMGWLSRQESDRLAWFLCDTSVRSGLEKSRYWELEIPVPPISEQKALFAISAALRMYTEIETRLRTEAGYICSILINGALKEAAY